MKKYGIVGLFLVVPLAYLFISWIAAQELGYYFLFVTDPEYAYLLNGLNILNLAPPDHVMGPGTPLHLFCALITQIVYWLRGASELAVDVLQNPDIYLFYINHSIIVLISIILFFTGYVTYKSFNNHLFSGIFVQFIVLSSWLTIDLSRRIMVESLVIPGVLLLLLMLFRYANMTSEARLNSSKKYLIGFSLLIGFISATKFVYVPIAIIPFILLKGFKQKFLLILFSIVSFFIFGFAVFYRWDYFFGWYWNNFIHSGTYGAGEQSIIDAELFVKNLKSLFSSDSFLLPSFILVSLGVLLYHLPILKIKQKDDVYYKLLLGMYVCMLVMIVLVSKQFKYYYFITGLMLQIPALLMIFHIYTRKLNKKKAFLFSLPFVIFIGYYIFDNAIIYPKEHHNFIAKRNAYLES